MRMRFLLSERNEPGPFLAANWSLTRCIVRDGATKKLIVHCTEITVTHPSPQDIIQFASMHDVTGVYPIYLMYICKFPSL